MKKLFVYGLLSLSLIGQLSLSAEEPTFLKGKTIIESVEVAYAKGEYQLFLKALDEEYQRAGKAGLLRSLLNEVKKGANDFLNSTQSKETLNEWEKERLELIQKRNRSLLEACAENPDLELSKKIDEITAFKLSSDEAEAIAYLKSLENQVPEDNHLTPENKFSALALEYRLKNLLLGLASTKSGTPYRDLKKKSMAIVLEEMDKMQEASKGFKEEKWSRIIAAARSGLEKEYAHQMDLHDLKDLANGKILAQDQIAEKVKTIMADYLNQEKQLAEKYSK